MNSDVNVAVEGYVTSGACLASSAGDDEDSVLHQRQDHHKA